MDTRFIETLVEVAHAGSFAGAALRVGLTANAVAQRIRALEAEIGQPLVARAGRKVRPTEAGHAVIARAEGFLAEARALRGAAAGRAVEGELHLGAIATALTGLLPPVLDRLAQEHLGLRLFLEPGTSSELHDRVLARRLDAAILVEPSFNLPKGVAFSPWRREPLVLLVPADERRDHAAAILSDRPLILYDRGQWGGRLAADWLHAEGFNETPRFELDALDAIAVLVARGLGVSVVPDWAGPRPEGLALRQIALPAPRHVRCIGLLHLVGIPRLHLIRTLQATAEVVGAASVS